MQKQKNNKGISMVTLVITIVIIIILVTIAYRASTSSLDKANYTKYSQELADIKKGVDTQRLINAKTGLDENTINKDFKKVHVQNPPDGFVSFDADDLTAYLVDLSTIDYEKIKTGQEYKDINAGDTVTFEVDDVYIYDKMGTVYYVKGMYIEGEGTYFSLSDKEINGPVVEASNTSSGIIVVSVTPTKGGEITSVLVGGEEATKGEDGKYTAEVDKNGTYLVVATEEGNGTSKTIVVVSKVEEGSTPTGDTNAPTNASMVINNGEPYTREARVTLHIETDAQKMFIRQGGVAVTPDVTAAGWRTVSTTQTLILSEGENQIYGWFRNEGNSTWLSAEASMLLDTTPPTRDAPSVVVFNEQSFRITAKQTDPGEGSGIKKIQVGYKCEDDSDFTWQTIPDVSNPVIEIANNIPGKNYTIKTKAEDNAGNESESKEYQTGTLATVPGGIIIEYNPTSGWTKRSSIIIRYPQKSNQSSYERWYRIAGGAWKIAEGLEESFSIEENATIEAVVVLKTESSTTFGESAIVEITNIDSTAPDVVELEIN